MEKLLVPTLIVLLLLGVMASITLIAPSLAGNNATHLGAYSITYEVEANLLSIAANVVGQAAETDVPGIFNILENYTITGGTGQFATPAGALLLKP